MSRNKRRPSGAEYQIHVVGAEPARWADLYHAVLRWRWRYTLAVIAGGYLAANAVFALLYLVTGGIAGAEPASFKEAFFFSVQTMGTIGYGALFPRSDAANVLVVAESLCGLLITAVATGLVFAKFSRSTARFLFTREAVVGPMDGVLTLSFRLSNLRSNQLVNAEIHATMVRTEHTREGKVFYRMVDVPLARERALTLSRSWTVLHTIDPRSPLFGETSESLAAKEAEIHVMVVGLDDTFMQTVHASHRYFTRQILFGHRHVDVLSETPAGDLILDLRRFHDVEPLEPAGTGPGALPPEQSLPPLDTDPTLAADR